MDLVRSVLRSAVSLLAKPAFAVPCAALALISNAIVHLSGWPAPGTPGLPTSRALTIVILVILGRAWLLLSFNAVALAKLRGERANLLTAWVPVTVALEILIVTVALGAGVLMGTLALIVPGIYLLLLWSQAVLVIVDRQARFFAAANWSASLTDGYRLEIAILWAVVFGGSWLVELEAASLGAAFGATLPPTVALVAQWTWRAVTMTFGVAMMSALYLELSSRASWQPELERVRPGADARLTYAARRANRAPNTEGTEDREGTEPLGFPEKAR
jgi:hypothetical protein